MKLDDRVVEGGRAIADEFATYFKSVYEPCQLGSDDLCRRALHSPTLPGVPCLNVSCVSYHDVLSALKNLKPKRSLGPDGIPPYILKACADFGNQVDVIYTDFEKAFDKVDHLALLSRLNYFGFSEGLLKFFCSYLRGRKQFVSFEGHLSEQFDVDSDQD
ncbi:uncharacterized protein LOC129005829 [Macrosteles quadrilineatus]|uniref:uncharacterized protein LOC129005829 n=1 Tax=Macrosteles quadrilineatus TaxID=74068 RepID=UPI0023E12FCC|nr:uncharacterized protein LOC129005829 [Macrosteles quadrilineatus]